MGNDGTELLQGTLYMLILKAVVGEPMHGFGIARRIERVTNQRLTIEEGALYPALHRMEKRGWIEPEWQVTENKRRAKYYRITPDGRSELEQQIRRWEDSSSAVEQVLREAN